MFGRPQNLLKLISATNGSMTTAQRLLCRTATPVNNRRAFSSGMTEAEREAAMKAANDKMKAYFTNRPPIEKIINSKKRSEIRDREHYIQALIVGSFLAAFIITPWLGKKIATDEGFRKAIIPSWYDFSLSKPKSAWTRAELHDQIVEVQRELHERAIRGDFSPEKMESMRRHFDGVDPDADEHGWGKLHPGVEDDEEIED